MKAGSNMVAMNAVCSAFTLSAGTTSGLPIAARARKNSRIFLSGSVTVSEMMGALVVVFGYCFSVS